MKFLFKIAALMLVLIAMPACSSHKKAVESVPGPSRGVKARPVSQVQSLAESYAGWQTFYAPFTLHAAKPMNVSVSGRASMVRNEFIFLSFRMLGFEVATVYIDSDSAVVADKYHKMMASAPLDALTSHTGMTVGELQDILLGQAFYPGKGNLGSVDLPETLFSPDEAENGMMVLMPRRIPQGVSWWFTIDALPSLRMITIEPEGIDPFVVVYEGIVNTPGGNVASETGIAGHLGSKEIEASIDWNMNKANWNSTVKAPSLSFKGYRRLSAEDIISALRFSM